MLRICMSSCADIAAEEQIFLIGLLPSLNKIRIVWQHVAFLATGLDLHLADHF